MKERNVQEKIIEVMDWKKKWMKKISLLKKALKLKRMEKRGKKAWNWLKYKAWEKKLWKKFIK